ncbi:hypothetical protein [Streptomyces sp. NPDC059224]|uniref:hypothetical protein n=1 Tax=Streptomyces sp. NPDC059224 TaxID=3346775 RepID=UPI0036C7CA98
MLWTGEVPPPVKAKGKGGHLPDLAALMVMGGLSGRNGETVKELAADLRVLDGRAVVVNLLKGRRNKARTRQTIHWDVGRGSSRVHTPGGWFPLLNELAEPGRAFSGSERVWSIWTGDTAGGPEDFKAARCAAKGHIDPFSQTLGRQFEWNNWVSRHGLTANAPDEEAEPQSLVLTMNRPKKTAEVRSTRAVGGHLPSASRTNTPDVSFLHYLRNDPSIRDWARRSSPRPWRAPRRRPVLSGDGSWTSRWPRRPGTIPRPRPISWAQEFHDYSDPANAGVGQPVAA